MPERQYLLRPADLDQLKKQARELLKGHRAGDAEAGEFFAQFHPKPPAPAQAKLADAQLVMARRHYFASWPRLKLGVALSNAIHADDAPTALAIVKKHPKLLDEPVNGEGSNWGPPLGFSVQVNAPKTFAALLALGGQDGAHAMGRATLKGRTEMAHALLAAGTKMAPGEAMSPCESLNGEGLRLIEDLGAPLTDASGDALAPVGMVLQTYSRDPDGKHRCLAILGRHVALLDTPAMAFHLGRIDLLEQHLAADPALVYRRFTYREIYPLEAGCHEDETLGLHGTPLDGTTLLQMAVDFDEIGIARWLLDHGADASARANVDADGFGGHTPLFNAVVSQPYRCGRQKDGAFARLLLDAGADVNARASIRKGHRFVEDETVYSYRDVTPLGYGTAYRLREWVNPAAMQLIAERGGTT